MATQTLTRPPQEDKDQQTSAANDQTHFDKEFSALTSDGHYSKDGKNPQDPTGGSEDLKAAEENATAAGGAKDEASWKLGGAYGDKDEKSLIDQAKKIRLSRRKKAAGGALGGGLAVTVIITLLLGQAFKIPITIGGIHTNMPGDRTMRRIVERRFDRIITQYLIDRAAGSTKVKEGSLMDKLYKGFDKVDLAKKIEQKNGIKYVSGSGGVRVQHLGKDLGPANNYQQVTALKKKDKNFARDAKGITTRTFPIMRLGKASVFRIFSYKVTGIQSYRPLEHDEDKTDAENEGKINERMNLEVKGEANKMFAGVLGCIFNGVDNCPTSEDRTQPVDTTNRAPLTADLDGNLPEDREANDLSDTYQQSFDETNAEMAASKEPAKFNFMEKLIEKLVAKIIGGTTAKFAVAMIPFFGWINAAAEIVHVMTELQKQDVINKMTIMLKETQYSAASAQWAGFADNTAAGKTPLPVMAMLGSRLNDTGSASMSKALSNKDPSKGVPVDPQVGSNLTKSGFQKFTNNMLTISQYTGLLPLTIWYNVITVPLNLLTDALGSAVFWALKNSTFFTLADQLLTAHFGANWEAKLGEWAMNKLFTLFGMTIDALATGAKLYNNIAVGWDVLTNMFVQRNLGGQEVSTQINEPIIPDWLTKSNQNHQEYMASLPLQERLFSTSEPSSLFARLIQQTPDSADPASIISVFTKQLAALPATLVSLLTGNAWAATVNQVSAVSGVAQFDLLTTDTAEISTQVLEAGDQPCPENKPGFSNTCVADKTVTKMGLCGVSDSPDVCPELNDTVPAAAAPGTDVSATGDPQALAAQIMALERSSGTTPGIWFSNSSARSDMDAIAKGGQIAACGGVTLDPALLNLILAAAKNYNIGFSSFLSGRGVCNDGYHPMGQAMDVSHINGSTLGGNASLSGPMPNISASLVKKFMEDISRMIPSGRSGGLGQRTCTPLVSASYPAKVVTFADTCHHLHIDVRK